MGRRARRKAMASLSDSDRDDEMEKGHGSEKHAATVEDHAKRLQDHDYRRELHAAAAAVHEDAVAQSRHARHAERRKVRHEKAMERELAHLDEEKESYEAKMLKIYKKHSARREKLDAKREHKEAKYRDEMAKLGERMAELGVEMDKHGQRDGASSAAMMKIGEEMARLGAKMERARGPPSSWKKEKKDRAYQQSGGSIEISGNIINIKTAKEPSSFASSSSSSSSSSSDDDVKKPAPRKPSRKSVNSVHVKWDKDNKSLDIQVDDDDDDDDARNGIRRDDKVWQAVMANNVEGLRALFRKRRAHILFSLEYRDEQKRTPLMMACTYGFADCMRLLVEHGANLHAVDKKGNTPLHYACINGQFAIVAYLVQHTLASPFDANKSDATPLQLTRHVLESKPANWLDLAKCIELLEQRVKVFEGWLYESAPNLVADVLNIASMQSWKARYALVLRNGSRDELELHLFDVRQGLRPPIPTSIRQVPITNGVQFNKSERWWNKKPHSFLINGLYEFAALDTPGFDLWFRFFETDAATMVEDRTVITEEPSHKILVQDDENDLSSSELSPTHHLSPSAPDAMDAPPLDAIGAWGSSPPSKTSKMAKQASSKPPAPPAPPAPPVPPLPPRTTPYSPMPPTPKKDKQVVDLTAASGDAAPAASAPDFEADDATPGKPAMLRRKSSLLDDGATSDGAKRRKGKDECVVCYDRPKATVCVPCGHVAVCVQCAETLRRTTGRCPICRGEVREVVKLFHV